MDGDSEDEKLATSTRAASGVLNEGVRMVSAALFYICIYACILIYMDTVLGSHDGQLGLQFLKRAHFTFSKLVVSWVVGLRGIL